MTGILLGLRPSELVGLTWRDVDFEKGVLHVRQARLHEPGGIRFGEPKTQFSIRAVTMPDRVADALRRHRAQQAEAKLAAMIWSGLDLVFCAEGGAPLSRWRVSTILNAVTERSGLGKWQPREMRHTAISLLYDAGLPDERVGDVVGHAPGSRMTAGTYRHPLRESADGAAVAMNEIFGGVQSSQ